MVNWIQNNDTLLFWLGTASIAMIVASAAILPWLVVRLPADYFAGDRRAVVPFRRRHPGLRAVLLVLKNGFGAILVAAGIAMLILPGQGILAILLGLSLLDMPGKFKLQVWLVKRRPVRRSINWIRRKAGKPPLRFSDAGDGSGREGATQSSHGNDETGIAREE